MHSLIGVESDPAFALGVVCDPVEHHLGEAEPPDPGDHGHHPSVDKRVAGEPIEPVRKVLSVRRGRLVLSALPARHGLRLKGKVGQSVPAIMRKSACILPPSHADDHAPIPTASL